MDYGDCPWSESFVCAPNSCWNLVPNPWIDPEGGALIDGIITLIWEAWGSFSALLFLAPSQLERAM